MSMSKRGMVIGVAGLALMTFATAGCKKTAELPPGTMERIEAAANKAEMAANKAEAAARSASDSAQRAEAAASKAEAIFSKGLRK